MSEQVSCLLVELLADEQGEPGPDALPLTYMDGSRVT